MPNSNSGMIWWYFGSRCSLGKAWTSLCHVFVLVISTPGQGQQLMAGLLKKMVRRSTSSKGVEIKYFHTHEEAKQGHAEIGTSP